MPFYDEKILCKKFHSKKILIHKKCNFVEICGFIFVIVILMCLTRNISDSKITIFCSFALFFYFFDKNIIIKFLSEILKTT